jgi:hypothetical protein
MGMKLLKFLKYSIRKTLLYKIIKTNYSILKGYYPIILDYPVNPTPRYGYGKPPHPKLYSIINKNRSSYRKDIEKFLAFKDFFSRIPLLKPKKPQEPYWLNNWIPGLDAVALYSYLCLNNPNNIFEIGSGNSTKFARKAIMDHGLRTKITVIDPNAKKDISSICDVIIRQPLEEVDICIFDELGAKDILFIDSTHRVFMNSDVTVIFLDVLPRLRSGVLIQFHDVLLPYDYPPTWSDFYFSEQYLLAVSLLMGGNMFDIILPNFFISKDNELNKLLDFIWNQNREMREIKKHKWSHGWSFWVQTK